MGFGDSAFERLWDALLEKIQAFLAGGVQDMLCRADSTISDVIGIFNDNITATPSTWNEGEVFKMLRQVSDTAIVPIGIGIMSIVLCYDLITACIDSNNFKEFDISIFFRFIVKAWVAIYLINNVFSIITGLFEIGANIADVAIKKLLGDASSMSEYLASEDFKTSLCEFSIPDLAVSFLLSLVVFIVTTAIIVIVMIVTAGRMMEILMYISAAPIPFATMTNKEWGNIGFTYIRNILALALQAFFIVVVLAIYITLFNTKIMIAEDNIVGLTGSLVSWLCYGVLCCFMLLKTGNISKTICGAH